MNQTLSTCTLTLQMGPMASQYVPCHLKKQRLLCELQQMEVLKICGARNCSLQHGAASVVPEQRAVMLAATGQG